jgi:ubiquitin conjugation factor E4 B
VDQVGGFKMPLPSSCPREFAFIPEHFFDDAMDLLIITSRIPRALEAFALVHIYLFLHLFFLLPVPMTYLSILP